MFNTFTEVTVKGNKAFLLGNRLQVMVDNLNAAEEVLMFIVPKILNRQIYQLTIQAPLNTIHVYRATDIDVEVVTKSNQGSTLN